MKERILKALNFCNLLDLEGKLSLTNLGLVVLLVRVGASSVLDWASVTTLALAFANYMHKRKESTQAELQSDTDQMKQIKSQYEAAVVAQASAIKDLSDKVKSIGEAVKVVDLSKLKLR